MAMKNINSKNSNNENLSSEAIAKFDSAVAQVFNIIISYDMGCSKRGNGKSYNSLNGYGSIIGFLSGKILDYGVRNRRCKFCDTGHPLEDHDCHKNHDGSAKSMEASVGMQLINRSEILEEAGLRVRVLVEQDLELTQFDVRIAFLHGEL
ncbi:hypothetical protein PV327_001623 [Microctonus hyperodae]|uniref:Mutator-like transposase domain-containing protein n=1 Tax=Microctonus hyperodae TaxID=165561 RepID=A0AA39FDV6_MICHY|nr:hypothetical protein PV327_001623 [Microctonus hyperodae]